MAIKQISTKPKPDKIECPKCGGTLSLKKGKFGNFYGCSNYRVTRCRFTLTEDQAQAYIERASKKKTSFNPTPEQAAFFKELAKEEPGNILLEACAGSGKTKTIEETNPYIPQGASIVYLVFNARNREEAQLRMDPRYDVMTTHQFGLRAYQAWQGGRIKIEGRKLYFLGKEMIRDWNRDGWLLNPAQKIIDLLKGRLEKPTLENIENIIVMYHGIVNVDADANIPQLAAFVKRLFDASVAQRTTIDFADMLYLPIHYNVPIPKYDFVLCDEVQDFNAAQIELVKRSIKFRGVFVGDRNQSIYGFRGAMLDSMDKIKAELNCTELPLSVCWRVPQAGEELVNNLFPYIRFSVPDTAIEGSIDLPQDSERAIAKLTDGDMVLCRLNAPLVKPCFNLLRNGRKAYIVGRDIGRNLIELIERFTSPYLDEFVQRLENWAARETELLLSQGKEMQAANVQDKVDTIMAIASGCDSCRCIIEKIEKIFQDDAAGIAFSTVHKAKGLEADNVLILLNSKMPHPMAKALWEQEQEKNIQYVAYTRFKKNLFITE